MPYGIPRVACCASLNLWTETHGVCGLPLSAYLTSELFMHTPHLSLGGTISRLQQGKHKYDTETTLSI